MTRLGRLQGVMVLLLLGVFVQNTFPDCSYGYIVKAADGVLVSKPQLVKENLPKYEELKNPEIKDLLFRHRIKSIDDYARWLKKEIQYQHDQGSDQWATPQETLKRRSGDCEDLAFLTKQIAEYLGYKAQVLALVKKNNLAHAFCIIDLNGRIAVIDNTKLVYTKAKTFEEIAVYFSKKESTKYIFEFKEPIREKQYVSVVYPK